MPKPEIKEPFVTESMKLPKEIAFTGDIDTLNAYLNGEPLDTPDRPLGEKARRHLEDRIANIRYVNELAQPFRNKKYIPLSAKETENGCILEGIRQPERQQTGHCCRTMPAKFMLQSRGIDLDQETIRCYKPEVTTALREYRSPVALLKNGHYRTIVGIDGDDLIVKDSLSAVHGPDENHKVPIASLFSKPGDCTEITFMRDLTVTDAGVLPEELKPLAEDLDVGAGDEKGKLTLNANSNMGFRNNDGSRVTGLGYDAPQYGKQPVLLNAQIIGTRTDTAEVEVTEEWILPEKLTENDIADFILEDKAGSIGEKRYALANDILDLSGQFSRSYEKCAEKTRVNELPDVQSRSSVSSIESFSI